VEFQLRHFVTAAVVASCYQQQNELTDDNRLFVALGDGGCVVAKFSRQADKVSERNTLVFWKYHNFLNTYRVSQEITPL